MWLFIFILSTSAYSGSVCFTNLFSVVKARLNISVSKFHRRRSGPASDDELVPLALSSDSDIMDDVTNDRRHDSFQTPPTSPPRANGFADGDVMYKEKPPSVIEDPETRCGYWSCRPELLQHCNNPKCLLLFLCFFSMAQGFVVNGINNVNTSTIERRFQLPSSRVGLISSAYDLSAAILGIFISFMGSGRQKAKWVSCACVTMAVGSFIMALPHFTTGTYEWGQNIALTCSKEDKTTTCVEESFLQNYLYVLIVGQLLHGLGGTTLYTVGVSLIDDSVPASISPMYLGILYACAALGPSIGYIVGGQFLELYVDFNIVPVSSLEITSEDPRWVGAWWVGFVLASMFFVLAAIPISLFGSELPTAKHIRETRVSEMHADDGKKIQVVSTENRSLKDLKYLPKQIWTLLRNPPFLFITLAGATEGMTTSGFATFLPKFIQNQFGVTAGWSAMITGFMAVPGAAGGQLFGGYLCKRLNLKVKGCIKLAIITSIIALSVSGALWARCDNKNVAGITREYVNSSNSALPALSSTCNQNCNCHTELYEPVCDSQGIQYFSPCHAGCTSKSDDKLTYTNCSCVTPSEDTNESIVNVGKCEDSCSMMYVFIPLTFIYIFLEFTPAPAATAATLRCVHDNHRTLGLGLKWFVVRMLGTVPGPILFGAIIDSSCILWRERCEEHASCWIYDNTQLARNFFILQVAIKTASVILFSLAHKLYKPPSEKTVHYEVQTDSINAGINMTSANDT